MRVGAIYKSRNPSQGDYIVITKIDKTTCWYNLFTKEGYRVGDIDTIVSKATILNWGILANPKIKY